MDDGLNPVAEARSRHSLSAEDRSFLDTLLRCALAILLVGQAAAGFSDTDIWGHMSIGLDMLRERAFLWVDPYSFTHDQTWINHEWLWDLLVAAVYQSGGLPGLLVVRVALIGAVLWCVDRATRPAPAWTRTLTLCVVAVACVAQWRSTRPQIATLAIYALLLTNINGWWVPLLFLLWANVHGGWVFGLAAVATHAFVSPSRRATAIAALSAGATLVNPYGLGLWTALFDGVHRGWADVSEWQPVWRLSAGAGALAVWLLVAALTVVLWRHVARRPWPSAWAVVALAAGADSRRLSALAAISTAMLLVPMWSQRVVAPSFAWTPARRRLSAGVLTVSSIVGLIMLRPLNPCFPALPEWHGPEAEAVAYLRTTDVRRLVPHFDFGEYAVFHLRRRLQVAIDNRRETVYSDAAVKANQRFTDGLDPDYPDRIGADAVWWPASGDTVIRGLEQRGWVRRFEGPRTVVLLKSPGPLTRAAAAPSGTPCFPNP